MRYTNILPGFFLLLSLAAIAQKKKPAVSATDAFKKEAIASIDQRYTEYRDAAQQIWNFSELGYKEQKSSALLKSMLEKEGFRIESGVAGIPTAFVASYGSGSPVIGILAEYDALPGLSQQAVPEKKAAEGRESGHGCGHHLFGTASVAAGIELKNQLQKKGWKGTVKVFGCPAEEGGSGKVYMVREGLFRDVDIALHWHPGNENESSIPYALANKSAKFRFYGKAAHASASPERGRSSLDAVEAMNNMVNMMREHVPATTRIHYVITAGGKAPNVVPDFAEVYYYVRHPKKDDVVEIFDRIAKAAEGAALGTETTMKYEIIGGTHDLLPNKVLAEEMHRNLTMVGGITYSPAEIEFAKKIQSSFGFKVPDPTDAATVKPMKEPDESGAGSTDVGDVSYVVPTVGFSTATWVPGTPAHSWQAVACGGTEIGSKGMMVAAKTMATMGIELFNNPALVEAAKKEFREDLGNYQYKALLGDRKPALNYRD
jgi:aminobenzoyl-glutamate utilization protein B